MTLFAHKRLWPVACFLLFCCRGLAGTDSFVIQWGPPGAEFPWLDKLEVRSFDGRSTLTSEPMPEPSAAYPNGLRVTVQAPDEAAAWFQVNLARNYGFTFSGQMLSRHGYLWVRDLGIFISKRGTWMETNKLREAQAVRIARSREQPFLSCAEKYSQWTGYPEHKSGLDDKIWDFVKDREGWPAEERAIERISEMPEVDSTYFTDRFPDLKYSRMYLGWPDHNDKFILWNNGKIGVSSRSVGGYPKKYPDMPWLPRALGYTVQFGIGAAPRFREYGDQSVRQNLKDGHRLIGITRWSEGPVRVEQASFAYPLDGEQLKTGIEPLLAWTAITLSNSSSAPVDTTLGIEFTNEDFPGRLPFPLANLTDLTWRDGAFYILGDLLAVAEPSLPFEEIRTGANRKRFRGAIHLEAHGSRTVTFANFYRSASPKRATDARSIGYDAALERAEAFWNRLAGGGTSISVPDPLLNNLFRTFLPRVTINAGLDLDGFSIFHTGPIVYNHPWHHITAYAVADYLARTGHFNLAKRYLEPYFHWQGMPAPDSPSIKNWDGFFGAPPVYCPLVWLMDQGVIQWAAARYYQLSDDRPWLEKKLPALIKSMEWVRKIRSESKHIPAGGPRPPGYGWFPPGRVTDGTFGTSIASDGNIWRGMEFMTRVLESVHHPRAAEFREETEDYRECLQDGMRREAAARKLVRLNDGTWVPYLASYLERPPSGKLEDTIWYAAVADAGMQAGIFDTQVFAPRSPENWWLVNFFEDSFSPLNPSLPDEPMWACHATEYLNRDRINNFLYTFYSQSTTTMARQTLTTYELRSAGEKRVFELTGWAAGYWTRNFTDMLCRTVGDELWLMQATPRRWLNGGEKIHVENLQTEFGVISFDVRSRLAEGVIEANVAPPNRVPAKRIRIRFRTPGHRTIRSVSVDGRDWRQFDPAEEWITLPESSQRLHIVARY